MKILVTGVNGQLGCDVVKRLGALNIECRGVDIADFDLTDEHETLSYIKNYAPDAIIHCAAYTAVDKAQDEPEICENVNVTGTLNMLKGAECVNAKLMYISTDYVFEGVGDRAYKPHDAKNPKNVYGRTKLLGEIALKDYEKSFIVRTSWVFGKNGNNFIKTMLKLSLQRSELNVVDDQIGSPTYTYDLARLLCDMIVTEKYAVYHATNEGYCSWAELARYAFECAGKNTVVHGIPTEGYPTKALRPKNSRLDKTCLDTAEFARLPHWRDAVKRYVKSIEV